MQRQPTLLNSCAMAATAAEAAYRINAGEMPPRSSRVIALDARAAEVVDSLATEDWRGGHFLTFERTLSGNGSGGAPNDGVLRTADGAEVLLSEELTGADVAVVIATSRARPDAAAVIGDLCAERRIMTAGFILADPDGGGAGEAVNVLRPNVMVLMVLRDQRDIPAILTALRV